MSKNLTAVVILQQLNATSSSTNMEYRLQMVGIRGDPDKTQGRREQITVFPPNGMAGSGGGGLHRILQSTGSPAHPTDP
ncbi:hypothetical protein GJAV_G00187950 [Gymnothorax javanicus]|nr:hypothetical protein GJAV_G00187950 [Gymnothorax javanicus]